MSHELGVLPTEGGAVKRIVVKDQDMIFVNGKPHLIEELEGGDAVEITTTIDPGTHKDVREIHATRSGTFATGKLVSRDDAKRTIEVETDEAQPRRLTFFVPVDLKAMSLNGQSTIEGRPVTLLTLRPGDDLDIGYFSQGDAGDVVNKLKAQRQIEIKGTLATDCDGRTLNVIDSGQKVVKLPFKSKYVITVNGQPLAEPAGLKRATA